MSEESAPALKGTPKSAKVSEAKAEGERKAANVSAKANGAPNTAMREGATGAESDAGKIDGGKAPGKAAKKSRTIIAPKANPAEVNPVAEKGGSAPLFKAPEGAPDDLKLISGVGPVLERRLNDLGITQYAQVAAFTATDIERVDAVLNFRGRVARDNWKGQAKALAMAVRNRRATRGVTMRWNKKQLPCFCQWKHTAGPSEGYVTGMEPATNYPNLKTFERERGRVMTLDAGQRYVIDLAMEIQETPEQVAAIEAEVAALLKQKKTVVHPKPIAKWSPCAQDA